MKKDISHYKDLLNDNLMNVVHELPEGGAFSTLGEALAENAYYFLKEKGNFTFKEMEGLTLDVLKNNSISSLFYDKDKILEEVKSEFKTLEEGVKINDFSLGM